MALFARSSRFGSLIVISGGKRMQHTEARRGLIVLSSNRAFLEGEFCIEVPDRTILRLVGVAEVRLFFVLAAPALGFGFVGVNRDDGLNSGNFGMLVLLCAALRKSLPPLLSFFPLLSSELSMPKEPAILFSSLSVTTISDSEFSEAEGLERKRPRLASRE